MSPLQRNSVFSGIAVAAWMLAGVAACAASPQTIVPGKRIGRLALKSYPGGLPLGKPHAGDAGMSHYHYLWVSKRRVGRRVVTETTFVAAVSNGPITGGPGETVEAIRVTSPYFRTADGIATGKTLADIRRRYRHLRAAEGHPTVLEDEALGIAFEFPRSRPNAGTRCIAISVFKPDNPQVFDAAEVDALL